MPTESYTSAFIGPLQNTLHRIVSFIPRLLIAIVLFLLFYGLAVLARWAARRGMARFEHLPWAVKILVARSIYLGTLLIGILVALSAANVDVTTVIASLGVAGFALGFALKDILENFISGILLLFARPFKVRDQVTLSDYEGTVVDIQIRTTTLRTYNDEIVLIPNSKVYTNPVVNHTKLGRRRYTIEFDTSLTAEAGTVQKEALRAVQEDEDVLADPAPFIRIKGLDSGNDVLTWQAYYWAAPVRAVEVKTISDIFGRIKQYLYDAGVPTPTSTSATIFQQKTPLSHSEAEAPSDGD